MELRVLGPVEVFDGERLFEVTPPQRRHVMAALAIDAGRPVTNETLIDRVWDQAPAGARQSLRTHVTRIRRLLKQASRPGGPPVPLIHRYGGGYVLDVEPERVDLHRFRRLVDQARDQNRPDGQRVGLLREAIALWRGEPLAGLPGQWAARTREAWRQQYLTAVVAWAHAELRVDNPAAVITPLSDLAAEFPLAEPLAAVLMRALSAAGRPTDALEQYTVMRQRLAEDLGTDPSAELQAVHQAILRGGIDLRPAPAGVAAARTGEAVPAQLPADVPAFAGRNTELAQLDTLLTRTDAGNREAIGGALPQPRREASTAMVVSVVSGTAGVGKTALAVHWSHRVADRFGDGQLYVNLRGFHGNDSAVDPAEAVRWFLDALGVPPDQIPSSVSVQIGLYRTLLAGRRVLIMLDNARDADQVRPLLPGSSACMVVVTSRNQLTGLVATEGAYLLTLDVLARAEARELLAQRLGAARVAAEPEAVNSLVGLAARLPLALAIVAARAAAHPHFPLAALARELRESRGGLDAFAGGDQAADVRAVLSWSYRALSPAAARLFRLLGLHPGPDIATAAAASLADLPAARVRPLLSELTGANLITEHIPGRYHFHDLLRAYATELVHRPDSDAERRAATARMFSHYLHTAHAAAQLLDPHRLPITLDPLCPGVLPEELADREQAVRWFTTEHPTLVSAIGQAAGTGFDAQAWRLAGALVEFLARRGHWHDFAATQRTALIAAERLGDPAGQAHAHHGLGRAYGKLGRYQSAHAHYQHALNEFGALADRTGQGSAHLGTGWLFGLQGRYREALNHARLALDLYQSAGNRAGQANTLNALGWYHAQLGDHEQAIGYCQSALALHAELGERHGEANTWDSLGYAHHQLHRYQQAASHYRRAIDLYRDAGDRYGEAETLTRLGDTHRAAGALDTARDAWRRALTILDELGHRNAARARSKLRSLDADDRSIRLRLDESRSDTARAPRCPGHQRAYPIS